MDNNRSLSSNSSTIERNGSVEAALFVLLCSGNTICVMAILLNFVSLVAMMFLKDKSTAYHRFLKNLSITDLLGAISFLLIQHAPNLHSMTWTYIIRSLPWMFFTAYCLTLLCLSVIQYIAVCVPWRYSVVVTDRAVNIAIGLVWIISTLQLLVPILILLMFNIRYVYDQETIRFLTNMSTIETLVWMGVFVIVALISTVLHISIYCKIRQLKRRSTQSHDSDNMRMKQRAFVTMAILLCTGLLIRIPFLCMSVAALTTTLLITTRTRQICNMTLRFLLYLNFFTDPCVYGIKLKEVRECYFELVRKIRTVMNCSPSRSQREIDSVVVTSLFPVKTTDDGSDDDRTSPC